MTIVFPIIAIFLFVLILFVISQIVVRFLWAYRLQLNPAYTRYLIIAISLFIWFIIFMLATFWAAKVLVNFAQSWKSNSEELVIESPINKKDCTQIIDAIYLGESKIHNLENHRYIEGVAPLFTIKIEYKKGAEKLKEVAQQYLNLKLHPESKTYTEKIANKLQEKAELFEQRSQLTEDGQGTKKIVKLLEEMDRVTQERLDAIETLEEQCN